MTMKRGRFTAQIDDWYVYLRDHDDVQMRSKNIEVKEEYRAFVAYDPEGYYLEWHVFNDAPINAEILKIIEAP